MNIEEMRRNTFIANLSGIAEHFNEQEVKCITKSNMITTIQLVDNDNIDMIIRSYRKDKSLLSYSECKENKRHGKVQNFYPDGILKSDAIFDKGKTVTSKEFYLNGKLWSDKYYHKGRLHGECKYYFFGGTKQIRIYNHGTARRVINFRKNNTKTKETYYCSAGFQTRIILYNKKGIQTKDIPVNRWVGWYGR